MHDTTDNDAPGQQTHPELMYVVCATCKAWYDVKPGRINQISHGLCPKCYEEASKELDAIEREADTSVTSTSNS
jgi:hypothetical protein